MKDSELCRKAADLIQTRGLVAGIRENHVGELCILGALDIALSGDANSFRVDGNPVIKSIVNLLSLPLGKTGVDKPDWRLADWSNAVAREGKPEVVINGLRRAADILETQERTEA